MYLYMYILIYNMYWYITFDSEKDYNYTVNLYSATIIKYQADFHFYILKNIFVRFLCILLFVLLQVCFSSAIR